MTALLEIRGLTKKFGGLQALTKVDLVIEGDFGTLPIEIKFGINTDRSRLTSLKKFVAENDLPLGIVINNSEEVALLEDRIIQIPAGLL